MSGNGNGYGGWETLDVAGMLGKDDLPEAAGMAGVTTSANVGSFAVPLGPVLRRKVPNVSRGSDDDYLRDVPDVYKEMLGLKKRK